jgi:Putative DNA-binding domain
MQLSPLARQQQALLEALFEWPDQNATKKLATYAIDTRARGLKAYKTNGHMLAERALQAAYPVVCQLLGEESLADLARALWHAHPPIRGDLAQWGGELPAFLQGDAQLQDEPYLGDVARVEWAMHCCAHADDALPDLQSLQLLAEQDPALLHLSLASGTAAVCSTWPVASIVLAHLDGAADLAEAGALVRDKVAQDVVVWREGLRPRVRLAMAGEAACLNACLAGESLGASLEAANGLDFAAWFPQAVQSRLVLGVTCADGLR